MDWSVAHDLQIVHVGQSGTVLASDGAHERILVPLTFADRGLVPGGLHVGHAREVAELRAALEDAAHRSRRIDLSAWSVDVTSTVDLRLRASAIAADAVGVLAAGLAAVRPVPGAPVMDPGPQRRLADALATAVVSGSDGSPVLADLVGAGPGSTPAGDDVTVGVLAGFDVADRAGLLDAVGRDGLTRLREAVLPASVRTTWVARHDLRAAAAGRFCERVHRLAEALADPVRARHVLVDAARWGATSGLDLAHGLRAAAHAARPISPELTRAA